MTQFIPLTALFESPTNPRKTYNQAALVELAETIKAVGLLQPIKVRPMPMMGDETHHTYEIIFGHRRFRATKLAGLEEIECDVVDMTDEMVEQVQLIENLQRDDVDPVEEAEGLQRLIETHHMRAEDLAGTLGIKRTTIYNKLKLSNASPKVKEACQQQIIGSEIATQIARLPQSIQAAALKRVTVMKPHTEAGQTTQKPTALPLRDALQILRGSFTVSLTNAPFDPENTRLGGVQLDDCTACSQCPSHSDNEPALLADFGAGVCTDTPCFEAKKAAWVAWQIQDARNRDVLIFEGEHAKRICPHGFAWSLEGWVDIKDVSATLTGAANEEDQELDFAALCKIAGDKAPTPALLVNEAVVTRPNAPRLIWIITNQEALELVEMIEGPATFGTTGNSDDDEEAAPQEPPEVCAVRDTSSWRKVKTAITKAMRTTTRDTEDLRLVVKALLDGYQDVPESVLEAFGWDQAAIDAFGEGRASLYGLEGDFVESKLNDMSADDLAALALGLSIDVIEFHGDNGATRLLLAERYGVDVLKATKDQDEAAADDEDEEEANEPATNTEKPAADASTEIEWKWPATANA